MPIYYADRYVSILVCTSYLSYMYVRKCIVHTNDYDLTYYLISRMYYLFLHAIFITF